MNHNRGWREGREKKGERRDVKCHRVWVLSWGARRWGGAHGLLHTKRNCLTVPLPDLKQLPMVPKVQGNEQGCEPMPV